MSIDERGVVARVERVTLRELRFWVREGWVRPAHASTGPVFDEIDIARVRLLCDLRKEMAVPNDAVPVVLTLIDHLHRVRRDLRHLTEALEEQPAEIRETMIASVRRRASEGDTMQEDVGTGAGAQQSGSP
ncbi:MerR family transcriptional regulator [Jannaschia seohaensis]|uniref:Chaperone modulatory protein CbpM n=1 Tax=Jannaschia seohaensis TaxID=475081 RepID=A0A2Y9B059_9RHOB|nr:MerR family transcriptional regulator [Jannaschia seohaensis]PWJ14992.1 chaperone modulatory protein CbpM [Jannaschia seohaensis]SSA49841.1 chaperone modulatory protein CbpM [Jannaschia seohaensis]